MKQWALLYPGCVQGHGCWSLAARRRLPVQLCLEGHHAHAHTVATLPVEHDDDDVSTQEHNAKDR